MYRVANKRTYHGTGIYIGRPSVLGNPYAYPDVKSKFSAIASDNPIEAHRLWLWMQLQLDSPQRQLIAELAAKPDGVLICWCSPAPCHGDVIVRAIEWYRCEVLYVPQNDCV